MNNDWRPNLFIAGFAKCGTTELCNYLSQHSEIFMPWEKEPNSFYDSDEYPGYFSGDKVGIARHSIINSKDYEQMYSKAHNHEYRIDATVSYSFHPRYAQLLRDFSPNAKVLFLIRDQKQRLISMYFHSYIVHRESNFLRWMDEYFRPYKDSFLYYDKLLAYYKTFEKNMRVIESKNLSSETVQNKLFKFLNLNPILIVRKGKNANLLSPNDGRLYRNSILALASLKARMFQVSQKVGLEHEFNRASYVAGDVVRMIIKKRSAYKDMVESIPNEISAILDEDYAQSLDFTVNTDILINPHQSASETHFDDNIE